MKNLIFKSFFILFLFSLSACNNDEDTVAIDTPTDVQYDLLCNGNCGYSGFPENLRNTQHIINSLSEWNTISNQIIAYNFSHVCSQFIQNFDYERNTMLFFLDYERNYVNENSIKINSIKEYRNKIIIRYYYSPTSELPAFSQPYLFVKIPKTTKPIEFVEEAP